VLSYELFQALRMRYYEAEYVDKVPFPYSPQLVAQSELVCDRSVAS